MTEITKYEAKKFDPNDFQESLTEFAKSIGYPNNSIHLFLTFVFSEWDTKILRIENENFASFRAVGLGKVHERNETLIQLRSFLESTDQGKASIARIPKEKNDGKTTIIYPSLPESLAEEARKRIK